jgi:hypothetical protein
MTGARRRVPLRSPKTPIGSVDPYALKIPARRAGCVFTKPHCLHSPPSSIRGVAPPGPPKWLPPPPPLTAPVPPPSRSSLFESTNPSSSSRENDDDARPVLAEESEDKLMSRPKPKVDVLDREFSKGVIAAFVKGDKPSPTSRQLLDLQRAIPDEPEARVAFLPYLSEKMPRIKHPGSLPSVAEEFTAAWPALAEREQAANASVRGSAPEALTAENLRAYLESTAAAVPYPEIAYSLRRMAADVQEHKDLESLEQELTALEKKMMALAPAADSWCEIPINGIGP